jgi:hypothetical protein
LCHHGQIANGAAQQSVVRYCIASSKKDCINLALRAAALLDSSPVGSNSTCTVRHPSLQDLQQTIGWCSTTAIDGTYHLERVESSFDGQRHWILDSHSMLGGKDVFMYRSIEMIVMLHGKIVQ